MSDKPSPDSSEPANSSLTPEDKSLPTTVSPKEQKAEEPKTDTAAPENKKGFFTKLFALIRESLFGVKPMPEEQNGKFIGSFASDTIFIWTHKLPYPFAFLYLLAIFTTATFVPFGFVIAVCKVIALVVNTLSPIINSNGDKAKSLVDSIFDAMLTFHLEEIWLIVCFGLGFRYTLKSITAIQENQMGIYSLGNTPKLLKGGKAALPAGTWIAPYWFAEFAAIDRNRIQETMSATLTTKAAWYKKTTKEVVTNKTALETSYFELKTKIMKGDKTDRYPGREKRIEDARKEVEDMRNAYINEMKKLIEEEFSDDIAMARKKVAAMKRAAVQQYQRILDSRVKEIDKELQHEIEEAHTSIYGDLETCQQEVIQYQCIYSGQADPYKIGELLRNAPVGGIKALLRSIAVNGINAAAAEMPWAEARESLPKMTRLAQEHILKNEGLPEKGFYKTFEIKGLQLFIPQALLDGLNEVQSAALKRKARVTEAKGLKEALILQGEGQKGYTQEAISAYTENPDGLVMKAFEVAEKAPLTAALGLMMGADPVKSVKDIAQKAKALLPSSSLPSDDSQQPQSNNQPNTPSQGGGGKK